CGVCHEQESKYKCKTCEIRYCSIPCYKSHKTTHSSEENAPRSTSTSLPEARTTETHKPSQTPQKKSPYANFENDQDFKLLMQRYPKLHHELSAVFAMTLEPGPEDQRTWRESGLFSEHRDDRRSSFFRGGRGGRSRNRGAHHHQQGEHDEKLRGPWTREKGDRQAQDVMHRLRNVDDEEVSEGMVEFIKLCGIKFGQ
ncbi:uncharacterized protein MYCFIDRAFT_18109, partial [Pseudocercospora fijiensis CIRAD86]